MDDSPRYGGLELVHKTLEIVEKLSRASGKPGKSDSLTYQVIDFFLDRSAPQDVPSETVQQTVFSLRDFFQKLAAAHSKASRGGDLEPTNPPTQPGSW